MPYIKILKKSFKKPNIINYNHSLEHLIAMTKLNDAVSQKITTWNQILQLLRK
jgi:hypothetical protein